MENPKILVLTIPHGASHQRVATALRKALIEIQPDVPVEVVDALSHCTRWFRIYYDSYRIPLRYWPGLWGRIEAIQHNHRSTGPTWLYRRGAQPLFRFIQSFRPDIVIATEVGMCELAAMLKRETNMRYYLVGVTPGVDVERPWAQPEVDLYPIAPGDVAAQLEAAGVPPAKILTCGQPIDPAFASLPDRATARTRLEIELDVPLLLVLFGGTGVGKPRRILAEVNKLQQPLQLVFITGRNRGLQEEVQHLCQRRPRCRVFGWVDNMHEWMAAADLSISKPGGTTVVEAMTCGLPLLALDPLPGNERRACDWIEKWQVGYWVKRSEDLAPVIARLLGTPKELQRLREHALALARPRAAYEAARAILKVWQPRPY